MTLFHNSFGVNFDPLQTGNPSMGTLKISKDPDEKPHNAAFRQGLHCLLRQNRSKEKKYNIFLEIITCDPSIFTMSHPDFIVCSFKERSIGLKRIIES